MFEPCKVLAKEIDLQRTHPRTVSYHEWRKAAAAFADYESKKKKRHRLSLLEFLGATRYRDVLKGFTQDVQSWHYRVTEEHYQIIMAGNSPHATALYHVMWIRKYNGKKPKAE